MNNSHTLQQQQLRHHHQPEQQEQIQLHQQSTPQTIRHHNEDTPDTDDDEYRIIELNVGGARFTTYQRTLTCWCPYFQALFNCCCIRSPDAAATSLRIDTDKDGALFIDRSSINFHYIIDYCRMMERRDKIFPIILPDERSYYSLISDLWFFGMADTLGQFVYFYDIGELSFNYFGCYKAPDYVVSLVNRNNQEEVTRDDLILCNRIQILQESGEDPKCITVKVLRQYNR
jgi:hypothetical protein